MIVAIHQPEHLPWLGFFDKLRQADVWVMLDHVQYARRYFHNRNRLRGVNGPLWVTVPVQVKGKYEQPIDAVRIDNEGNPKWRQSCWASLTHCYTKAPYFSGHSAFFEDLYNQDWDLLVSLNEAIIRYLLQALDIQVRIVKSSDLDVASTKGELMLEICEKLGATAYLSGISGRDYLDESQFAQRGVKLKYQEFHHPIYQQLYDPFEPCMSAVDLLFNHGPESLNMIKGVAVQTMDQVFI